MTPPLLPAMLLSAALWWSASMTGAGQSGSDPDNPPVDCGCCECYDFEGVTLTAGGTEVDGSTSSPPSECTEVSADSEGQISLEIDLPDASGTCETCDETSLELKVRDDNGKVQEGTGTLNTSEWESPLTITVECNKDSSSSGSVCLTFKICWEDCGSCSEESSGACEPEGENGSVSLKIPVGKSNFGDQSASLHLHRNSVGNPGRSALKLQGWDGIAKTTDGTGLTSVTTQSSHAAITAAPTAADPNAYTVKISSDPTNVAGSVFRTITVENLASGVLQVSSDFNGSVRVMQWSKSGSTWTFTDGNGLRKVEKTVTTPSVHERVERVKTYERDPDDAMAYLPVSDVETEYFGYGGRWVPIKKRIDPDGVNLVSTWTYYNTGEETGPGSYVGIGRIKDFDRYDGYYERHSYFTRDNGDTQHDMTSPYGAGTKTRTRIWWSDTKTLEDIEQHSGTTIARTSTIYDANKVITRRHTSSTAYLETVREYYPVGTSGLGNKLKKVTHPDGTAELYTYSISGAGQTAARDETRESGAISGAAIVEGTRTVTTVGVDGIAEEVLTTAISAGAGDGITLNHWIATSFNLGRPTEITWFPTGSAPWVTTRIYSCCGLKSETDKFGIETVYDYDSLRRPTRINRLGITVATKYDGLVKSKSRYPEDLSSSGGLFTVSPTNEISRTVGNLAGTLDERWGASPQTGALVKLSTATTTYRNPRGTVVDLGAGIGRKTVTEMIQVDDDGSVVPKQSSLHHFDGRLYRSWGDLGPAIQRTYSALSGEALVETSYIDGISVNGSGGTLRETSTAYHDRSGRLIREYQPGRKDTYYYYNGLGQLERTADADGVNVRYGYNTKGERTVTAHKRDATTGEITWGTDRITSVETFPAVRGALGVLRSVTKVWEDGDISETGGTIVSTTDRTPDGRLTWKARLGVANEEVTELDFSGGGDWTTTFVAPDGSYTVKAHVDGLWHSTTLFDTGDNAISSSAALQANGTTRGYDEINRRTHVSDSRTGVTETAHVSDISDVVTSVTDPGSRVTTFTYDHRGRRKTVDLPNTTDSAGGSLANITTTTHFIDGSVKLVDGGQNYKAGYTYDYAGRMLTLTTYGDTTATTSWNYSSTTGLLTSKTYPDGFDSGTAPDPGPTYHYTAAGRLKKRIWARGNTTRYDYDTSGRMTHTRYFTAATAQGTVDAAATGNDPLTSDSAFLYDSLDRLEEAANAHSTIEYGYHADFLTLATETVSIDPDGSGARAAVSRTFERGRDALLRPDGYQLLDGTTVDAEVVYTWHSTHGRLEEVSGIHAGAARDFTYGYESEAYHLTARLTGPAHTVEMDWMADRDVLDVRENKVGGTAVSQYDYAVNDIGQRVGVDLSGSQYSGGFDLAWGYDSLGQVKTADRSGGTLGDRGYKYDGIGNRYRSSRNTTNPDTAGGNNLAVYKIGTTGTSAEGANALNQYRRTGLYQYSGMNQLYDLDGNQETGRYPQGSGGTRYWDGENQMYRTTVGSSNTYYAYDPFGRRVAKYEGSGTGMTGRIYFYDGWNVAAECVIAATTYPLDRTYTWGTDLSGSTQGAGGVGGLLAVEIETGGDAGVYYPTYDGNGNVSEYLDGSGTVVAHYEYDPFGESVVETGSKAGLFTYQFSTKPLDAETGYYYYGYRYYDPVTGRWPSRDPIGERGGLNLYGFLSNEGVSQVDLLGLSVSNVLGIVPTNVKIEASCVEEDLTFDENSPEISEVRDFIAQLPDCCCISSIEFSGHGGPQVMEIKDGNGLELVVSINPDGSKSCDVQWEDTHESFIDSLGDKLCPDAEITFNGCQTASEPGDSNPINTGGTEDNIAKKTSEIYPDATVSGNKGFSFLFWINAKYQIGLKRKYKNGKEIAPSHPLPPSIPNPYEGSDGTWQ